MDGRHGALTAYLCTPVPGRAASFCHEERAGGIFSWVGQRPFRYFQLQRKSMLGCV